MIGIESNLLRNLFRDVYFINGTAYAGKSTMVRMLAQKHQGIHCGENYHDALTHLAEPAHQPNLCYFDTMKDWQEFIHRTPEEYDAWIKGVSEEAAQLELMRLIQLAEPGRKIFVDTNISPEMLHEISDYRHVAIMLAPQNTSVRRFFDRNDPEKQFLFQKIQEADNPEATLENFNQCLARINAPEKYEAFARAGFFTLVRDDARTPEETMALLEQHFQLNEPD